MMADVEVKKRKFAYVGDIRGTGLFSAVDMINAGCWEATEACAYVQNRARDHRIPISSEGPQDNVLKTRRPQTIDPEDAAMITITLEQILAEVALSTIQSTNEC
jgi:4-aminobutyrate aminotransferase-like enzyme